MSEFARSTAGSLLLCWVGPALAEQPLSLGLEVTTGYDSNPAQSEAGMGLFFAQYAFDAARRMRLGGADLTFAASGWLRDYEAANDSHRLALRTDWSRATAQGAGLMTLSLAGAAYRDALVPADERDEAALTLRYDYILTARDTLGLMGETRRLAYRNASLPWSGRPGSSPRDHPSGSSNSSSNSSGRGREVEAVRRDDWLSGLGIDVTHHWSPVLATVFSLAGARRDSPVSAEAYDRHGLGLVMRIEPAASWRLELGLGWSRTRYDQAPRQQEREDIQRTLGLAVRRNLGRSEWFCGLDWLDSDSSIAGRSFRQEVTECGLAWSF
ncbi:hypothetical protein CKO27_09340 [Thiocystis violacea]|nr:hypothetical protein [Thiocystis violacea]